MQNIGIPVIIFILLSGCINPDPEQNSQMISSEVSGYDSLLARELGADNYGMKRYIMAFLIRGDSSSVDSAEAARLQRAHLDNITRMAEKGQLLLAGPFLDSTDIRGIYIFNVSTIEEAEELTSSDPAIKAGVLKMELHPWYGSATLQKINEIHALIQKDNI
ncbi:MAG: YciI family protein [Bacteroidota bacterium]|nr:YciI family protein [Bacteroidota bacterium]